MDFSRSKEKIHVFTVEECLDYKDKQDKPERLRDRMVPWSICLLYTNIILITLTGIILVIVVGIIFKGLITANNRNHTFGHHYHS